jgi:putative thioredoxin
VVVDVDNFETQVIEASREEPVLVDFWAPWCGPCRQLGPVLEKIAGEADAGFKLAKVNTDLNPEVSQRYAIHSIPAVKLFLNGEVIDEFIGALPEAQVRTWLSKAVPNETRARVADARQALDAGESARAIEILEEVLSGQPNDAEANGLLARAIALEDPERATGLARAAGTEFYDIALAVKLIAELARRAREAASLPEDVARESFAAGLEALAAGDADAALGALVQSVRLNRTYQEEAARRACVAIFKVLGDRSELTRKHRRALEMALF